MLTPPPLDSETGWTGELGSDKSPQMAKLRNTSIFFCKKKEGLFYVVYFVLCVLKKKGFLEFFCIN